MSGVKVYKCLNCKAGLSFHPPTQKWKCEYCLSEFNKTQLDEAEPEAQAQAADEASTELEAYRCTNCGAQLVTDATLASTHCLYCKSPAVIKTRFEGKFKPQSVIPFYLTQEQAEDQYREWLKDKRFVPDEFKAADTISEIKGVYAPYWLFNCQAVGRIEGEATETNSYVMGDYRITNTKHYQVVREGKYDYDRVPVDASKKLREDLMLAIEPFDYRSMTDFSLQYMSGFLAEQYDISPEEAEIIMAGRVEDHTLEQLRREVSGYGSFQLTSKVIDLKDKAHSYAMMPVYVLVHTYQGKEHLFMINGQTGKIWGEAPVSRQKQASFAGIIFAAVWVLGVLGGALLV